MKRKRYKRKRRVRKTGVLNFFSGSRGLNSFFKPKKFPKSVMSSQTLGGLSFGTLGFYPEPVLAPKPVKRVKRKQNNEEYEQTMKQIGSGLGVMASGAKKALSYGAKKAGEGAIIAKRKTQEGVNMAKDRYNKYKEKREIQERRDRYGWKSLNKEEQKKLVEDKETEII